jgi:hypothetical protein
VSRALTWPAPHLVTPPSPDAPRPRTSIGMAATENADRAAYQSARTPTRDGRAAELPLTLAEAWAEAERIRPGLFGDNR